MIVSCGEALIDFLPRKDTGGDDVFRPFAGGSPFNVAIALGRLGVSAGFFSGLSTDFFGAMLMDALKESAVDTASCVICDRPTTLAFVTLIGGHARYAFFDEGSAGRMLTEFDLPAFPREVAALHFGSFSLAQEPCGSTYEALLRNEGPLRVISLDPNVRPSLIKNRDAYLARLERLVEFSDIVKFSEDDLEWIAAETPFEDIAAHWLRQGAKLVILTRGADGARAISKTCSVVIPGIAVEIADTIGAGDTFSAGVLAHLERKRLLTKEAIAGLTETQIVDTLSFAATAAAITASRPGADPPRIEELSGF